MTGERNTLDDQRKLLQSLGFGFVEEPLAPPKAPESQGSAPSHRPQAPKTQRAAPPQRAAAAQPREAAITKGSNEERGTSASRLSALADYMVGCEKCNLSFTRRNLLTGGGNPEADLFIIIEQPSPEDDESGKSLQGELGELLLNILKAMKMPVEETYVSYAVRCMPPAGRAPRVEELQRCYPYLKKELEIVAPRAVLSFGASGLKALNPDITGEIGGLRGRWHDYRGIPIMPTFSLSYMNRNKDRKRSVWEDVQKLLEKLK